MGQKVKLYSTLYNTDKSQLRARNEICVLLCKEDMVLEFLGSKKLNQIGLISEYSTNHYYINVYLCQLEFFKNFDSTT